MWRQKLASTIYRIALAIISVIRPGLGGRGVCIYQGMTCQQYVAQTFATHYFPYAFLKSLLRIVSCNPITALIRYFNVSSELI